VLETCTRPQGTCAGHPASFFCGRSGLDVSLLSCFCSSTHTWSTCTCLCQPRVACKQQVLTSPVCCPGTPACRLPWLPGPVGPGGPCHRGNSSSSTPGGPGCHAALVHRGVDGAGEVWLLDALFVGRATSEAGGTTRHRTGLCARCQLHLLHQARSAPHHCVFVAATP
jgi:hypothetical protein